jgi:hypothetical protein
LKNILSLTKLAAFHDNGLSFDDVKLTNIACAKRKSKGTAPEVKPQNTKSRILKACDVVG